ncbi:hypothetical protein BCR33DRAFT_767239 [Rhizoclosmatium globosum]|uniref:RlpA-like protein double-psi beta-barrel domain-containing protein n=1 Tax=Rhizoclosmatium globosum TaxID=329046 RepID=A0A1Y2C4B1_9FUNG|nr:hypothetical protein BCR33DRAFT_767239 [Rhizoclosmatium globosum]|eukprot:ORY41841.1 hypothetical protein BCR33DRAFT_767239 [Rhizoclosmatium globosum]
MATAQTYTGDLTYYEPDGGYGKCGNTLNNGDYVVAVMNLSVSLLVVWTVSHQLTVAFFTHKHQNPPQYNDGICGNTVCVTNGVKSVQGVIADRCAGCAYGSIDVTPPIFTTFADTGAGRLHGISWYFGTCGSNANAGAVAAAPTSPSPSPVVVAVVPTTTTTTTTTTTSTTTTTTTTAVEVIRQTTAVQNVAVTSSTSSTSTTTSTTTSTALQTTSRQQSSTVSQIQSSNSTRTNMESSTLTSTTRQPAETTAAQVYAVPLDAPVIWKSVLNPKRPLALRNRCLIP